MWARNLLFIGLILGGAAALTALLFPPSTPSRVQHFDAQEFQAAEFRSAVDKVDAAIRQPWSTLALEPAPQAPELTVIRRLSLALTGTIPSLQEIRQREAQPAEPSVVWTVRCESSAHACKRAFTPRLRASRGSLSSTARSGLLRVRKRRAKEKSSRKAPAPINRARY